MSELTIREFFALSKGVPFKDAYGIELELEQISEILDQGTISKHLSLITEDNSLRNNGYEFVSRPIGLMETLEFFNDVMLTDAVKWGDINTRCNERGSVHVHVNMANSTVGEVLRFLRFYCMLEPQFFNEVADHRKNNIYCVPLAATRMPSYIQRKSFMNLPGAWHKYTALNLKPITTFGTVEFRHLQATENSQEFFRWMRIIYNLQQASRELRTADISWEELLQLHERVFACPAILLDDLSLTYQEDVLNRNTWSLSLIQQRIKESKQKKCAESSVLL